MARTLRRCEGEREMDLSTVIGFLNQGWVGTFIAVMGIGVAYALYRKSRVSSRPAYQMRALRLLGLDNRVLPDEIQILFKGKSVPRVTRTYMVFWNAGTATLRGTDLVADDPLCIQLAGEGEILTAAIARATRPVNKFAVLICEDALGKALIQFDYLDPQDGAVVEVLHTSSERNPTICGTIRGVPEGVQSWGMGPRISKFFAELSKNMSSVMVARIPLYLMAVIGIVTMTIGFVGEDAFFAYLGRSPRQVSVLNDQAVMAWTGVIYTALPLLFLWTTRRRFPKSLAIPELRRLM